MMKVKIKLNHSDSKEGCKLMVLALAKYKGGDKMDEIKRVLVYYLERLEREELNKKISWVFDCKVRLVARYRNLKGHVVRRKS